MDVKTGVKLLESEGKNFYEIMSELQGVRDGARYLKELLGMAEEKERGLLEHEIVKEVHRRAMGLTKSDYSKGQRYTLFNNKYKYYGNPKETETEMTRMFDAYNDERSHGYVVDAALVLISKFMKIHPFGDGNGRTLKLLLWYTFLSFYPEGYQSEEPFYMIFPPYETWCQVLYNEDLCAIKTWLILFFLFQDFRTKKWYKEAKYCKP